MDPIPSQPGSPIEKLSAGALQPASSDRVNQQRDGRRGEDNVRDMATVSDKISQFNSLAMQSKQLERKTADAALKRAMLGREEAENEMRRYRDEARALRKQVEEGRERERRVGERLETVIENFGRAKETHAHTQALWEKEIRRARKETFKSQSVIIKLQEELASARAAVKSAEEMLDVEKERSKFREQEAFTARYSLVGMQEQLDQSQERIRMLEQERDAFKTLAKNHEDIAQMAAEGRLPLPPAEADDDDDEFTLPEKKKTSRISSISTADTMIQTSATSEADMAELTMLWQWEKHRAERALEHVDFLQAECELNMCPCAKLKAKTNTVFVPTEGVSRTVSHQMEPEPEPEPQPEGRAETPVHEAHSNPPYYARTPSVEPPDFAMLARQRTSLLSLLDAPHGQHSSYEAPLAFSIPTTPGPELDRMPPSSSSSSSSPERDEDTDNDTLTQPEHLVVVVVDTAHTVIPVPQPCSSVGIAEQDLATRPHTSAAFYTSTMVTTTVPLKDQSEHRGPSLSQRILAAQRTPRKAGEEPSWDMTNPALTPTMTREQALAQIRERRARSGAVTPMRQMLEGVERRDVSAPVAGTQAVTPGRRVRS